MRVDANVRWPSARTAVVGVIGDPVDHSLSPVLHNAALRALGLDWVYVAFPVAVSDVDAALAGAAALGVRGLSVTMPHKDVVARIADVCSETVERLGAANTLVFRSGALHAHSTDGAGFLADLREDGGFDPAGRRCVVIGAGGAARAVVLALAEAGAVDVAVLNRTLRRAASAALLAGSAGRVGLSEDLANADLVVKATPIGMVGMPGELTASSTALRGDGDGLTTGTALGLPVTLGAGQLAVDLVYSPTVTPFLAAAAAAGAATRNGLGMLVHQAARQFELWTGVDAPLDVMREAARAAASVE